MGHFEGGPIGTPARGATIMIGLSLALPNRALAAELEGWHAPGAPYTALILASHDGQCQSILTADLAVVLLGSLEGFWDRVVAGLPVGRRDQLDALRVDARTRFDGVVDHPDRLS
jgi:hypothetical protein